MHRMLLETAALHVLDLAIPPAAVTKLHTHRSPIFYVTIVSGPVRLQEDGKDWVAPQYRAGRPGDVQVNESYFSAPLTHRVENAGSDTIRSILLLNERDAPAFEGDAALPGTPGLDTAWFQQSRIELAPGAMLDSPGLRIPAFLVMATDAYVTVEYRSSELLIGAVRAGDVVPVADGVGFTVWNRGDTPATLIAVAPR